VVFLRNKNCVFTFHKQLGLKLYRGFVLDSVMNKYSNKCRTTFLNVFSWITW
jgi:hypothetical protein